MKLVLPVVLAGVLATANPGVLERVEWYRVTHEQADFAGPWVLKLGVENCKWLGWRGFVIVPDMALVIPAHVTDCQEPADRKAQPLRALGIAADVGGFRAEQLNHKRAIIVLRQPP